MRFAVMGSGGTGGYFGGLLAHAGEDVTFIARGAHLAALRAGGLTIKSRLVGDFTVPVQATDDPKTVGQVDLVLFCVKAYDTDAAAEAIRPLVGSETTVLPLQNGIDAVERLSSVVGVEHLVGGVAFITSNVSAPGTVAQTGGPGKIIAGEPAGGNSPRIDRMLRIFGHAGISSQSHPEIQIAIWEKFVFICAFGGLTALTRLPIGPILASRACRALFEVVMQEVMTVAAAKGIDLPAGTLERGITLAAGFEPWARGSLLHDLESGRRMELEALNGTVVRLGRAHGLAVPFNSVLYAALEPYAEGAPQLPTATAVSV
jgi:2-dehydropantoate 2-reductase